MQKVVSLVVSDDFEFPEGFGKNVVLNELVLGNLVALEERCGGDPHMQQDNREYMHSVRTKARKIADREIELVRKKYEDMLRIRDDECKFLRQCLSQAEENKHAAILGALEPVIKFYDGTNQQKGKLGEESVYEAIRNDRRFSSAEIMDTSGQAEFGDLNVRWRGLHCLIEIKNKAKITLEDLDKFARDMKTGKARNVNCGIFFTLRTDDIPGKTKEPIHVENIAGMPVIYAFVPDLSFIYYSFYVLRELLKLAPADDKGKKLADRMGQYYKELVGWYDFAAKQIRTKKAEIRILEKKQCSLGSILELGYDDGGTAHKEVPGDKKAAESKASNDNMLNTELSKEEVDAIIQVLEREKRNIKRVELMKILPRGKIIRLSKMIGVCSGLPKIISEFCRQKMQI